MTELIFPCVCVVMTLLGVGIVAWRARCAHRTLWKMVELYNQQAAAERGQNLKRWQRCYGRLLSARYGQNNPVQLTAQYAEDVFLIDYFEGESPGFFVEVGAYDGIRYSNTYALEQLGWQGVLVEENPVNAEKCRKNRPKSIVEHAAIGGKDASGTIIFNQVIGSGEDMLSFVSADETHLRRCNREGKGIEQVEVPYLSMDQLVLNHSITRIDLLSIDIEGGEVVALGGLNFDAIRPRLILLEANDEPARMALDQATSSLGYRPIYSLGCNVFYEDLHGKCESQAGGFPRELLS